MNQLRRSDLSKIIEILRGAYEPHDLDQFTNYWISALPKLVEGSVASIGTFRLSPPSGELKSNFSEWATDPYNALGVLYVHETGCLQECLRTREPRFIRNSRVQPFLTSFSRTNYYNLGFRRFGMRDACALFMHGAGGEITTAALARHEFFSERDEELLNVLAPHFVGSYKSAQMISTLKAQVYLLTETVNEFGRAGVTTDLTGTIKFETAAAAELLARYFEKRPANHLPQSLNKWIFDAHSALAHANDIPKVRPSWIIRGAKLS